MSALPAVRVDDLCYRFPAGERDALRHVDWRVPDGAVTLVVGPSGAGKTTLLRCLNGLIPHFHGGHFGGDVVVLGRNTRDAAPRDLAATVGVVFQDPEAQLVTDRVEDELVFGMENLGIDRRTMRVRLEETLDLLGIAHLRDREVATLSGGERQRVAIAAALVTRPALLVLDEPTSQLDPLAAHDVLAAVERLNSDLGMTVVIAEHRLDRVLPFSERLVAVDADGIREGTPRELLATLADVPPLIELARAAGWQPLPLTVRDARRLLPPPDALAPLPAPQRTAPGEELLRAEGLRFAFDGHPAIRDVSLGGHAGEVIALIGRNGSGKTTLLKLLMGLLRPASGRVLHAGADIARAPLHEVARHAGYVPQHPTAILHQETLLDELRFTLRARGTTGDPHATLTALGIARHAERHPLDLAGGERQRAALAAILVGEPAVLLLDEPTRGLPEGEKRRLGALLRDEADAGRLVVVATHDVEFVARHADRVLMLAGGEVIATGAPRDILAGSLTFATQLNRVFGGDVLTVDEGRLALGQRL